MRDAFIAQLSELAAENHDIMLVTGDLGFGVLTKYAETYPAQYVNVGVAEQQMTGFATGLALAGKTVFTYSIANFPILRCLEQIRNDACYHGVNVNIVSIGGGFSYGSLGISHHATEDLAIMRALPDITVVAPGDLWEVQQATTALTQTAGVGYLRIDKSHALDTHTPDEVFTIGKARIVRAGTDFTIIATGGILGEALKAAATLSEQGVSCRVISMHTIKPIDREAILAACRETSGIITIEEHNLDGGLGSAVAEVCMDAGVIPSAFRRMALMNRFSSIVGSQEYLRRQYGLDAQSIITRIHEILASSLA